LWSEATHILLVSHVTDLGDFCTKIYFEIIAYHVQSVCIHMCFLLYIATSIPNRESIMQY